MFKKKFYIVNNNKIKMIRILVNCIKEFTGVKIELDLK